MRIGIDARELCGKATGVGRYLRGLLTEWARTPAAHEFVLYAHQAIALEPDTHAFTTRVVAGNGGTWWEQTQLPGALGRDSIDVLFAPAYTSPLSRAVPVVLAMHDVSFAAHPEWFGAREGLRRRWLSTRAARAARAITTLSEFSKQQIVEFLGVSAQRIHIIRPGIVVPEPASTPSETTADTVTHDGARILYVGSIFNRRHIPDLIRAVGLLTRTHGDVSLDLVGDNRTHPHENIELLIERERLGDRIRWHHYVTDEQLATLYRRARAFAFLSEYEGLGLTPLEALATGVPSVLLDTPIARESCGPAALFVPRGDVPAIAASLERLLFDRRTRDELLAAGPAVLARYSWPDAARATLEVIEAAR